MLCGPVSPGLSRSHPARLDSTVNPPDRSQRVLSPPLSVDAGFQRSLAAAFRGF